MTTWTRRRFLTSAALATSASLVAAQTANEKAISIGDLITNETQAVIDRGLAYLSRVQQDDGGYPDGQYGGGNVAVTALAGLALMAGGHQPGRGLYGRAVSKAVDYVIRKQTSIGLLSNVEAAISHSAMYQHGFGTLFLAEVYGMLPDSNRQQQVRDALDKAVLLILSSQERINERKEAAGWRYDTRPNDADVSVTVAMMMALRAAKNAGLAIPKSVIDAAVLYVKACQVQDGGFVYRRGQQITGSGFARSAAAVVGLYSAGIYDGKEIENGLNYLVKFSPNRKSGWGNNDVRAEYFFYGQYYAALAMWTASGNYWAEWFPAIRDELINRARTSGTSLWQDFHGPAFATACACIILQLPNNYLPILQK